MRKLWFSHLARALIVFPGGFGTLDEFMEIITLAQTQKINREIIVLLYGTEYWKEIINFDAFLKHGMIDAKDLKLIHYVDDVQSAFDFLINNLPKSEEQQSPAIAKANFSCTSGFNFSDPT
jgi:uncharacterized protein (TIGR00730 family)